MIIENTILAAMKLYLDNFCSLLLPAVGEVYYDSVQH